jgi:hypothetical protein
MVANFNTTVIYLRILTLENAVTAVKYQRFFIPYTAVACIIKLL